MAPETSISKVGPGASGKGLALAQVPLHPKDHPALGYSFTPEILSVSPAHGFHLSFTIPAVSSLTFAHQTSAQLSCKAALSTLSLVAGSVS